MEKYFYFFDVNEVLIDRYPAKISNFLSNKYGVKNFIFIYSEKYEYKTPKKIPKGSQAFFIPNISRKTIETLFIDYPPNSLTTIGQRIPDMLMLSIFNINKIPTFIVQHGLWSDHLERLSIIPLIISKFSKFILFGKYTKELCSIDGLPFIQTIFELYNFFILDKFTIPNSQYIKSNKLRASKAFIFDESWDDYYINKYGYNKDDLFYIGNPDFLVIKNKDFNSKEDAVCYLCQTIVEDGRYLFKDYENFLQVLLNTIVNKKKLYIKLHPRSKIEYYDLFKPYENVVIGHDFPICKYYIGHYTSLLAVSKQITQNILIWSLKDHHMPQYFNQYASMITDQSTDIEKFIDGGITQKKSKKINAINWADFDPIQKIAEEINITKLT